MTLSNERVLNVFDIGLRKMGKDLDATADLSTTECRYKPLNRIAVSRAIRRRAWTSSLVLRAFAKDLGALHDQRAYQRRPLFVLLLSILGCSSLGFVRNFILIAVTILFAKRGFARRQRSFE
jgi:hypothetical protein